MKHLFFTLTVTVSLFAFQLLGSTIDDAQQALDALDALSLELQGKLHLHMNDQANLLRSQLVQIQASSAEEINNQINNISAKINLLAQNIKNTTGVNVNTCLGSAQTDLQNFGSELQERLNECYGEMIMTGNSRLYSTWARAWDDYDVDFQCTKMSFVQCRDFENASCVTFVMNNIDWARNKMVSAYNLLEKDMTNDIASISIPCQQMISQELALYPSLILNFVSSCLESVAAEAFTAVRCQ